MKKIRLDQLVFDLGFTESRERAKTTIMSGLVFVNNQRVDKPGTMIAADAAMETDVVIVAEQRLYAFDNFEHDLYNYTSTTENALLESTSPDYAFITDGMNSYGHPTQEVIDRLINHNIEVFRTDINGNITITVG